MNRRISKSFKTIFKSLYPNFKESEIENSEEYFFFILSNYPDKSEIVQLKVLFFIFSFKVRTLIIRDQNIAKFNK